MADNNNPIKYSDLIKPDSSITDLIKQLEELKGIYESALAKVKKEAEQLMKELLSQLEQGVLVNPEIERRICQLADVSPVSRCPSVVFPQPIFPIIMIFFIA